jgi:hypothetical protein
MTCFSSAAAIWAGDGGAGTGRFYAPGRGAAVC